MIALAWIQKPDAFLDSGDAVYVPAPVRYLGSYGVGVRWSRDGSTLLYQIGDFSTSVAAIRRGVAKIGDYQAATSDLVRYNVGTGRSETLARLESGRYFGAAEFVGRGGDVAFEVRRVDAAAGELVQLWFSASGGAARSVTDWIPAVTSTLACSTTGPRALFGVSDAFGFRLLGLSAEGSRLVSGLDDWKFGAFSGNTADGGVILALTKGEANQRSTGLVVRVDYRALAVTKVDPQAMNFEKPPKAAVPFRLTTVQSPVKGLKDASLTDDVKPNHTVAIAQGFISPLEPSPDGLKFAFSTPYGFFVRELVPVQTSAANRLRKGG